MIKKTVSILIIITLYCSCGSNFSDVHDEEGLVMPMSSLLTSVVIVDAAFNDRLNPESSSYFGEEYIEGIEFLVLKDSEKQPIQSPYYHCPEGPAPYFWRLKKNDAPLTAEDIAYMTIIQPPQRWNEDYGYMNIYNTRGFYFILLTGHCFIKYPDGSEDELRVQYSEDKFGTQRIEKVWLNKELAYERGNFVDKAYYYNPKYFPWMKPLLHDDGSQYGEIPDIGLVGQNLFFVITK